jgi:hypothetical protein
MARPHDDANLRKATANLGRERSANNPIGNRYIEMSAAIDAGNSLVRHLSKSRSGSNMNLLFSFKEWALQRHHYVTYVGQLPLLS